MSEPILSSERKRKKTSRSPRKPRAPKQKAVECPVCWTPTKPSKLVRLPACFCTYCKACIQEAFEAGLAPSCFPARCCGKPLDLTALEKHLSATLRRQYKVRIEQEAAEAPLYCANPDCREFISQATYKAGFGVCGVCHMKTCTSLSCKRLKKDHKGVHALCPEVVEDAVLRKLVDQNGWKRCPKCFCVVERKSGCDEIRCICKAEWCYNCGKLAKSTTQERCMCHPPGHVNTADEAVPGVVNYTDLPDLDEVFGTGGNSSVIVVSESGVEAVDTIERTG